MELLEGTIAKQIQSILGLTLNEQTIKRLSSLQNIKKFFTVKNFAYEFDTFEQNTTDVRLLQFWISEVAIYYEEKLQIKDNDHSFLMDLHYALDYLNRFLQSTVAINLAYANLPSKEMINVTTFAANMYRIYDQLLHYKNIMELDIQEQKNKLLEDIKNNKNFR